MVNIPSVYGGANLWGETDKKKARKSRAKSGGRANDLEWAVQGGSVLSSGYLIGMAVLPLITDKNIRNVFVAWHSNNLRHDHHLIK